MITALPAQAAGDARWQAWLARGFKRDRRRARIARSVMTAGTLALAAWLIAELVAV